MCAHDLSRIIGNGTYWVVVFSPDDNLLSRVLLTRERRRIGESANVWFRKTSALVLWLRLGIANVDILVVDSRLST